MKSKEDPQGPGVKCDVMHDQEQDVLLLAQSQQGGAQRQIVRQVERALSLRVEQVLHRGFAFCLRARTQVERPQGSRAALGDDLHRAAVDGGKGGAQGFMAAHDLVEALL